MTRRGLTMALAATLALATIAVARAQDPDMPPPPGPEPHGWFVPGPGGPGRGPHGGRFAEELGLTDDQKAQMESLRKKNQETLKPLADAAREAHEAFRAAMDGDNPDPAAVGQAALAMRSAEKALRAAHEASFEQMKSILTQEQRDKLDAKRKEHQLRGPRGDRGDRPHPPGRE
jgi:Spy/CpxP family protein refolding chaperone